MTTYTSEPGTRLGGRYRLEDQIAAGSGWAAWKAIDETLARAVTVFTFAQGFPRVTEVVTAARAASRLTDPRLAQVFDVEDAWDRAYIVMEWAAGETLGDLVSHGPLEPARAGRMIAEAAAALSSAHAAGVAHMCLSPGSVRWTQTGELKVVGLGIDAALSGISADDPVIADTRGLGRLLYAALTGCWPGPEYPALPAAPVTDGMPCSPHQVVAGVPLAFSDLACRAMQLRSRAGGPPLTMPGELARALIAALPPAPVPSSPPPPAWRSDSPEYPSAPVHDPYWPGGAGGDGGRRRPGGPAETGWSREAHSQADTDWSRGRRREHMVGLPEDSWPEVSRVGQDGPARHGRRHGADLAGLVPFRLRLPRGPQSRLPAGVIAAAGGIVVVAAIAAFTLWPSGGQPHTGRTASKPSGSTTSVGTLRPAGASGFDPLTSQKNDPGNENSQWARYAIDGSARTSWTSQWYRTAQFGHLKSGSGLLIDLGKPVRYSSVTVTFGSAPGAVVRLLVGNSTARSQANLNSMTTVASASNPMGAVTFRITSSVTGRYLVIWFTSLPPKAPPGHWYMAEIFNVSVRGRS